MIGIRHGTAARTGWNKLQSADDLSQCFRLPFYSNGNSVSAWPHTTRARNLGTALSRLVVIQHPCRRAVHARVSTAVIHRFATNAQRKRPRMQHPRAFACLGDRVTDLLESGHQPMMVRTACLAVHANDAAPSAPGSRLRWMKWLVCMSVRQVRLQAGLRRARTLPAGFYLCKHFMKIAIMFFWRKGMWRLKVQIRMEKERVGWIITDTRCAGTVDARLYRRATFPVRGCGRACSGTPGQSCACRALGNAWSQRGCAAVAVADLVPIARLPRTTA